MRKFDNVNDLVNTLKPDNPVYCIRPKAIKKSVEFFKGRWNELVDSFYSNVVVGKTNIGL